MNNRIVCWFSCGAASAVAAKLTLLDYPDAVVAFCDTGSEDEDNYRFLTDCEAWFGKPVIQLRSKKYISTADVWTKRKFISGPHGAPCTTELKIAVRLAFQLPDDVQIFGYCADKHDITRSKTFRETWFEVDSRFPLIERGLGKDACRALLASAGIAEPRSYVMGFPNANCLQTGCGKATSPDYWSLFRKVFPDRFAETARIARMLGARLSRIKDERVFIDDIPDDWPTLNPSSPICDFMCHIAEQDIKL